MIIQHLYQYTFFAKQEQSQEYCDGAGGGRGKLQLVENVTTVGFSSVLISFSLIGIGSGFSCSEFILQVTI